MTAIPMKFTTWAWQVFKTVFVISCIDIQSYEDTQLHFKEFNLDAQFHDI